MSDTEKPKKPKKTGDEIVKEASDWWSTSIIDIHPGEIDIRGYPIQDLIGKISFPQMIYLMLRGELPNEVQGRLLEAALVSSVDHGPHAPSIAIARMAMSCGVSLNGAMASAVNVLDDVHGGAGEQCMELHQLIMSKDNKGDLSAAVDEALAEWIAEHGKVIPGYGHRWHPVDPRSGRLLGMVEEAAKTGVVSGKYVKIGWEIEAGIKRRTGKDIPMNVDGATAVIFSELGFASPLGRGIFILSRSVGILAHAWEQKQENRRIKGPLPKSIPFTYTGPTKRRLD